MILRKKPKNSLHHICTTFWCNSNSLTICNYSFVMVEAAGVEPASENIPRRHLHTYPELSFSLFKSPPGWILKRLSCKNIRRSINRIFGSTILLVDALTGLAGVIRKNASLKRLERNYNHLRLYLIPHHFYKPAGAWYAT